jgi:hypothetical protein
VQQQAGLAPLALNGPVGHPPHRGDFGKRKPAEKVQVHQLGQRRVELGQFSHCLPQRRQIGRGGDDLRHASVVFLQRDFELPAPLLGVMAARVVDHQPPHGP